MHLAVEPYALNSASLANVFAIYLIGMVITPLSARLIGRWGSKTTILWAVGMSMLGVGMTLAAPLWLIIVALALMSSGVFITQAATISYIAANVKEGRSLASGLYYMAYYGAVRWGRGVVVWRMLNMRGRRGGGFVVSAGDGMADCVKRHEA